MNDLYLARKYVAKAHSSEARGLDFTLSIACYKKLLSRKTCTYTGLPLTENTRTLERIDNSKGYVEGNVIAVHQSANTLKSVWENPTNPLTPKLVQKLLDKLNSL